MPWAQGLLHLLLLFYFQDGSQTSFAESIRQKLRCFQVHPKTYTWARFQAQNAVYMKTVVDWRHFSSVEHYRRPSTFMYLGSTSQSVFRRESNRMSVAKKLTAGGEAQAELSIRFWVSNNSLRDYTLFLLTPCASYREAWVTEHCLIGADYPPDERKRVKRQKASWGHWQANASSASQPPEPSMPSNIKQEEPENLQYMTPWRCVFVVISF